MADAQALAQTLTAQQTAAQMQALSPFGLPPGAMPAQALPFGIQPQGGNMPLVAPQAPPSMAQPTAAVQNAPTPSGVQNTPTYDPKSSVAQFTPGGSLPFASTTPFGVSGVRPPSGQPNENPTPIPQTWVQPPAVNTSPRFTPTPWVPPTWMSQNTATPPTWDADLDRANALNIANTNATGKAAAITPTSSATAAPPATNVQGQVLDLPATYAAAAQTLTAWAASTNTPITSTNFVAQKAIMDAMAANAPIATVLQLLDTLDKSTSSGANQAFIDQTRANLTSEAVYKAPAPFQLTAALQPFASNPGVVAALAATSGPLYQLGQSLKAGFMPTDAEWTAAGFGSAGAASVGTPTPTPQPTPTPAPAPTPQPTPPVAAPGTYLQQFTSPTGVSEYWQYDPNTGGWQNLGPVIGGP